VEVERGRSNLGCVPVTDKLHEILHHMNNFRGNTQRGIAENPGYDEHQNFVFYALGNIRHDAGQTTLCES
jgi:hypothetical protein